MKKQCTKVGFETSPQAQIRSNEIYKENGNKQRMRHYLCEDCGKFHLTKMSKDRHKFNTNPQYRNDLLKKYKIKIEVEYWMKKLGIKY